MKRLLIMLGVLCAFSPNAQARLGGHGKIRLKTVVKRVREREKRTDNHETRLFRPESKSGSHASRTKAKGYPKSQRKDYYPVFFPIPGKGHNQYESLPKSGPFGQNHNNVRLDNSKRTSNDIRIREQRHQGYNSFITGDISTGDISVTQELNSGLSDPSLGGLGDVDITFSNEVTGLGKEPSWEELSVQSLMREVNDKLAQRLRDIKILREDEAMIEVLPSPESLKGESAAQILAMYKLARESLVRSTQKRRRIPTTMRVEINLNAPTGGNVTINNDGTKNFR